MPVAGLPAALETLLSSLLATEEPSSWRVDAEREGVVVILRFRQRDSDRQPLQPGDWRTGYKRKTPAARRRDRQRAEEYRRKSEQKLTVTFSEAPSSVSTLDVACGSQSQMPTGYVAPPSVTSDPSNTNHSKEEEGGITSASGDKASAPEEPSSQNESHAALVSSSGTEATIEALRELRRDFMEHQSALMKAVADRCANAVSDETLPPLPSRLSLPPVLSRVTTYGEQRVLSTPGIPRAISQQYLGPHQLFVPTTAGRLTAEPRRSGVERRRHTINQHVRHEESEMNVQVTDTFQ